MKMSALPGIVRDRLLALALRLSVPSSRTANGWIRLGTTYGGWWIRETTLLSSRNIVLVGAGEDVSFDIASLRRSPAHVWTVDPTPRALEYCNRLRMELTDAADSRENSAGDSSVGDRWHIVPLGVAAVDGVQRFYAPHNPSFVSHSLVNLQHTSSYFDAECVRVSTLLNRLRLDDIDVLKLDIEGAEHEVIRDLVNSTLRPAVILVEIDDHGSFAKVRDTLYALLSVGYVLEKIEGWNFAFAMPERAPHDVSQS